MVAVVVAYNRRELLVACLDALAAQTRTCERVVVVDNASTDGSADAAGEHPIGADIIVLARNTGGAGGFAAGIARALVGHAADLVWLLDDDTIPEPGALAALLRAREQYGSSVAVAGSRVLWFDGREHPMNTARRRPGASEAEVARAAAVGAVPVRSSSFVSMLVDADAVRTHGLPVADYFIWNDDFEFSCRLLKDGTGLVVDGSVVEHRTKVFGTTDADPGERFFYEVRNKIWLFTRTDSLAPRERLVYAGSTLRRWARTFARSKSRGVLVRAAGRGLSEGLRHGPRPTAQVLSGLGPVSGEVAQIEAATGG